MGMFDTFYDFDAIIKCPDCNNMHDMTCGTQSKNFNKTLENYHVGDVVESWENRYSVKDWDWCVHCKTQIPLFFGFKSSIFTGIYQTNEEALEGLKNFDVTEQYLKIHKQKVEFEKRAHSLEFGINETIKIHGSTPTKGGFSLLFNIHHGFIDYDIIQTLKNILNNNRV